MITSALIDQCRREFGDIKQSTRLTRNGDAAATLFNVGSRPIVESSYTVSLAGTAKTENTDYSLDLDSGDLTWLLVTPSSTQEVKFEGKFANWRDKNWVEAINNGVEELNARGFFRQIVRNTSVMAISANVRTYGGPSACIDLYEALLFSDRTISGSYTRIPGNWSYQQDANKFILGYKPSTAEKMAISYLRNLQTYSATSATLDVLNDWIVAVKKKAGANFYRHMAGKIAKQGNANVDEGHFSFTNLRTMAKDLDDEFDIFARRKKPTRPAKNMQYHLEGAGPA